MSIFKIISIDTINHIHQFETNSGKIFKTREEGFKAIIFFSYINVNNQYTEDELINMVLLLTAFQYYWLHKRSNFKAYGPKHIAVQKYIFDHYSQLSSMQSSTFLKQMYQIFK